MKHKKCGGKFIKTHDSKVKKVYTCNRCDATYIKYRRKKNE